VALVTGASQGIGECLARELAARHHDLVLVARRPAPLQALAGQLSAAHGIHASVHVADLAQPGAAAALVAELADQRIDVLVNNAGFGDFGEFWKGDPVKTSQMVHLNVGALTELTQALLPAMVQRGRGRVLNVASTAAFLPGPLMSVYYATKAYVLRFSEGLHEELKGTGVTVTVLCPGPVATGFQARAEMQSSRLAASATLDAATVARMGVDALLAGKPVVVAGLANKLIPLVARLLPRAALAPLIKRVQAVRKH